MRTLDYLPRKRCLLVVDDDPDDREIIDAAFQYGSSELKICFVNNGEELLNYLKREGPYTDEQQFPYPNLVLLDLNMPRKNGMEALSEIKRSGSFKSLPIVIFTTSAGSGDITKCYELGVNSYIVKPNNFTDMVQLATLLHSYWFNIVKLPF